MEFENEFDKENCWYKSVCSKYNTNECNGTCIRYLKMNYLTQAALLTKEQQKPQKLVPDDCDIEKFQRLAIIKQNIVQFVDNGGQLLITSNHTGNGKTTWAIKMIMSYLNAIWHKTDFKPRALFVNLPTFFNLLKENISESQEVIKHIKDNITNVDLVVWDEIGIKNMSNFEMEHFLSFIDARMRNGKANIFTSNLIEQQLRETYGDRLESRILKTSEIIEFNGDDKRGVRQW